jgi:uncharacterized membrane protein
MSSNTSPPPLPIRHMSKWGKAHDEQAVALYKADVVQYGGAVRGRYKRIADAPECNTALLGWPGEGADKSRTVAKTLSDLFTGRLRPRVVPQSQGGRDFTEEEDLRLGSLIDNADLGDRPWSEWTENFADRSRVDLKTRAHTIRPQAMAPPPKRCAYGLSRGERCANTMNDRPRVSFQGVPHISTVLSHLAISVPDWKESLVCCSVHGQNARLPLSATNLATQTAPPAPLTPAKRSTLVDTETPESERDRKRVALRQKRADEEAAEKVAHDAKQRRSEAGAFINSAGDPVEVVAQLLERARLAERKIVQAELALEGKCSKSSSCL